MTAETDAAAYERAKARMTTIDGLPRDLRECVHEYGWTVVDAFLRCGVRKAKHIRHIVRRVREGGIEIGNRS